MSKLKYLVFIMAISILSSCVTTQQLTPTEVKNMTTKQFDTDYDTAYKSVISLLQSEGFLITNTDKDSGLINANKQIDNKNAGWQMALIGTAVESSSAQMSAFIEQLNDHLTEVKLTIYNGKKSSTYSSFGAKNVDSQNSMVQNGEVYANWFNNLRTEIERRKAVH